MDLNEGRRRCQCSVYEKCFLNNVKPLYVYAAGSKAYSVLNTDSAVYGYVYIEVQDRNGNILTNNENSANTTKLTTSVNYSGYSTHYKARGTFHARIDGVYKTGEKFCYT